MTIHDGLVTCPERAERVKQIMVEAFESVGVGPTVKLTAFDLEAQDAPRSDPGTRLDRESSWNWLTKPWCCLAIAEHFLGEDRSAATV